MAWQKTDFPANRGPFLPDRRGALEEGGRTVRGEFATLKRASGKLAHGRKSLCTKNMCYFSRRVCEIISGGRVECGQLLL